MGRTTYLGVQKLCPIWRPCERGLIHCSAHEVRRAIRADNPQAGGLVVGRRGDHKNIGDRGPSVSIDLMVGAAGRRYWERNFDAHGMPVTNPQATEVKIGNVTAA